MIPVISVSDFLALANAALRTIPTENVVIEGEVADYRVSQGKWVNFDLKDEKVEAKLPCFGTVFNIHVPIEVGMRVRVTGYAKVFERFGKFSLTVESVEPVGEGALARAYALLKKQLADEGLFAPERKRSLPKFPQKIGLITSRDAAAYGDFLRILGNRWGGVTVVHAHVHVQGKEAVEDIVRAFSVFNRLPTEDRPEVIVLTRGGGSLEELHAFNDERVVRAVCGSVVPVMVGVGHERDETLADFVADVRASTPSNAAERVVPDKLETARNIAYSLDFIGGKLEQAIHRQQATVDRSLGILERAVMVLQASCKTTLTQFSYAFDRFRLSVLATLEHVGRREAQILQTYEMRLGRERERLVSLERLLESVDPQSVLKRGYTILRQKGKVIYGHTLAPGDRFSVQFVDGGVEAQVLGTERQEKLL